MEKTVVTKALADLLEGLVQQSAGAHGGSGEGRGANARRKIGSASNRQPRASVTQPSESSPGGYDSVGLRLTLLRTPWSEAELADCRFVFTLRGCRRRRYQRLVGGAPMPQAARRVSHTTFLCAPTLTTKEFTAHQVHEPHDPLPQRCRNSRICGGCPSRTGRRLTSALWQPPNPFD
jgi:hypothetical protein